MSTTMTKSFYVPLAVVFPVTSVLGDIEDIATIWPHTCVFRAMISKIDGRQAIFSEFHSVKRFKQGDYVFYLRKVIFVFEDSEKYLASGMLDLGPKLASLNAAAVYFVPGCYQTEFACIRVTVGLRGGGMTRKWYRI
ncbi:Protein of unknown function [Pyronema omphalodes CBS 100304]|uniref:Uncharacterized protein n=1 Tax=Pyronema omphalodes (strain CBS 100304) TaxID=1076935 RepID=U4LK16_PYROM|nr:Protein of unknown function [Pyronema omphalodes CBS 100304]